MDKWGITFPPRVKVLSFSAVRRLEPFKWVFREHALDPVDLMAGAPIAHVLFPPLPRSIAIPWRPFLFFRRPLMLSAGGSLFSSTLSTQIIILYSPRSIDKRLHANRSHRIEEVTSLDLAGMSGRISTHPSWETAVHATNPRSFYI